MRAVKIINSTQSPVSSIHLFNYLYCDEMGSMRKKPLLYDQFDDCLEEKQALVLLFKVKAELTITSSVPLNTIFT